MSNLSTLPKGDSAWLLRKAIERIIQQVSVLETNIGASTSGNSANTQIIFNDNGTLRGDAGLVYNKTTDALTVGGNVQAASATITGDLTVDTNVLKVDTTLNRVGIGTASPIAGSSLDVRGAVGTGTDIQSLTLIDTSALAINNGGGLSFGYVFESPSTVIGRAGYIKTIKENATDGNYASAMVFGVTANGASTAERYRIGSDGTSTWSVAGTTAMTLNSTGLGIGDAPATNSRLTIGTTNATGFQYAIRTTGITTGRCQIYLNNTSGDFIGGIESSVAGTSITGTAAYSSYVGTSTANPFYIVTNGSVKATVDSSGNVGIGSTSPNSRLQIVGATDDALVQSYIRFSRKAYESSIMGVSISASGGSVASQNNLVFNTSDGTNAPAERVRINGDGNLSLATGNVVMTTIGKGIDFSATAGTGTSELLADYEEGVFDAFFITGGGTVTINPAANQCRYTKIGRLVTVQGNIAVSSVSSPTGPLLISGLPYTIAAGTEGDSNSAMSVMAQGLQATATGQIVGYGVTGSVSIYMYRYELGAIIGLAPSAKAGSEFAFSMTYSV